MGGYKLEPAIGIALRRIAMRLYGRIKFSVKGASLDMCLFNKDQTFSETTIPRVLGGFRDVFRN